MNRRGLARLYLLADEPSVAQVNRPIDSMVSSAVNQILSGPGLEQIVSFVPSEKTIRFFGSFGGV
jgi:hypothetical protein